MAWRGCGRKARRRVWLILRLFLAAIKVPRSYTQIPCLKTAKAPYLKELLRLFYCIVFDILEKEMLIIHFKFVRSPRAKANQELIFVVFFYFGQSKSQFFIDNFLHCQECRFRNDVEFAADLDLVVVSGFRLACIDNDVLHTVLNFVFDVVVDLARTHAHSDD